MAVVTVSEKYSTLSSIFTFTRKTTPCSSAFKNTSNTFVQHILHPALFFHVITVKLANPLPRCSAGVLFYVPRTPMVPAVHGLQKQIVLTKIT